MPEGNRAFILQVINALCQKRVWPRDKILCAQIVQTESEFLDTPVHVHVHMATMHEWKTIMMVFIMHVQQITALPM